MDEVHPCLNLCLDRRMGQVNQGTDVVERMEIAGDDAIQAIAEAPSGVAPL